MKLKISKEKLSDLYLKFKTLKAVGRQLNIDSSTVKRYMQDYCLEYAPQVRYNCDHDFFQRENELSFYLAGFIAADGCIKNNNKVLSIALSKNDRPFLEIIKNTLNSENKISDFLVKNSKRNIKWNDTYKSEIAITSSKLCTDLNKFNIVERKSLRYTFPEWLIDHPLKHHFIRGYNDGDGSFYSPELKDGRTVKQVYFSLRGTPDFLYTVRSIFEKDCLLPVRDSKIRISNNHGILEYGGNGVLKKIVNFLYKDSTIYLDRKYEKIKHLLDEPTTAKMA